MRVSVKGAAGTEADYLKCNATGTYIYPSCSDRREYALALPISMTAIYTIRVVARWPIDGGLGGPAFCKR